MKALLLQYSPDNYTELKLKASKLFEFSPMTQLIMFVVVTYGVCSITYVMFLKLFMTFKRGKGIIIALLMMPIEMSAAYYAAAQMSKGMDLAYAGGGVYVIIVSSIIAGLLAGLILAPIAAKIFTTEKRIKT